MRDFGTRRAWESPKIAESTGNRDVAIALAHSSSERTTMRKSTFTIVLASSLVTLAPSLGVDRAFAQTAFSVSAHIGDFHVAVANYYQVPEREVIVIRERRIPDDEIPVALFIARHAGVPWATRRRHATARRLRGGTSPSASA